MKHVHTRICPLCSKKLTNFNNGKEDKYFCSEVYFRGSYDWNHFIFMEKLSKANHYKVREPHYSVVYEDNNFIQSTILPPYWIRTESETGISKIYKFPFNKDFREEGNLIMSVPIIEPSDYTTEKLVTKIKSLLIFL
jgi:hypothetical protein